MINNEVFQSFLYFALQGKGKIAVIGSEEEVSKAFFKVLDNFTVNIGKQLQRFLPKSETEMVADRIIYDILFDQNSKAVKLAVEQEVQVLIIPKVEDPTLFETINDLFDLKLYVKSESFKVIEQKEIMFVSQKDGVSFPVYDDAKPSVELASKLASNLSASDKADFEAFLKEHWG